MLAACFTASQPLADTFLTVPAFAFPTIRTGSAVVEVFIEGINFSAVSFSPFAHKIRVLFEIALHVSNLNALVTLVYPRKVSTLEVKFTVYSSVVSASLIVCVPLTGVRYKQMGGLRHIVSETQVSSDIGQ
jgi:hypothetical protein